MKNIKYVFTALLFTLCSGFVFSQTEKIELPDVTTVIEGENQSLKLPAPDFDLEYPLPSKTGTLVPALPKEEPKVVEPVVQETVEKTVSDTVVEGRIGGGYPPSFVGQFGVKNNKSSEPYSIEFIHDSVDGMAGKSLNDCYNSVNTGIKLFKCFTLPVGTLIFDGNYNSVSNGFQSKVEDLSAVNQTYIDLTADYLLTLSHATNLNFLMNGNFYNRYSDITDSAVIIEGWQAESRTLSLSPMAVFETKFLEDERLGLKVSGVYNLDMDLKGNLVNEETIYTSGKILNRGELASELNWKNKYVYLSGNVGLIFGDHQNGNKVLVPFGVKTVFNIPVKDSNTIGLTVAGGLKAEKTDIAELEKTYKYSAFSFIPDETSDWFGSVSGNILLNNRFLIKASVDYTNTSFNNGVWGPDYVDTTPANGLYTYKKYEISSLATDFSVDFNYNLFKITGKFAINLLDLMPLQNRYEYYAKAEYDSNANWKAFVEVQGALDAPDLLPVINTEVSFKLSPKTDDSLEILLLTKDLIKLVSGTSRQYAGCYICDSGSITLLVKFTL